MQQSSETHRNNLKTSTIKACHAQGSPASFQCFESTEAIDNMYPASHRLDRSED
jgi:hypothetical protein